MFALSLGTTGFWAYGPLLLETLFKIAPLTSGYILAGEALAWSAATMAIAAAPLTAGRALVRAGTVSLAAGAAGLVIAVPAGSVPLIILCQLPQGAGLGLCWPAIVQRMVRSATAAEGTLAAAAPGTVQRIGYAVGAAAAGITANLSGLAQASRRRRRECWLLGLRRLRSGARNGLVAAWRFTAEDIVQAGASAPGRMPRSLP